MADSFSERRGSKISTDSDFLALLGKKQVLKRRFGFWSLLAFAVCELITWETVLALFFQGFDNGGPAGLVYGFIIAWLSTLSIYACISELASMAPIACGQYYWVFMLAPPSSKKAFSYVVGWLTSLAWIATVATESLFAGTIIQGLIVLANPDYSNQRWQGTLITWLVIILNVLVNIVAPDILPKFQIAMMILHVCGFVAIFVTLLTTSDIGSAQSVWLTSLNTGGWSTQGLSYCIGFLGNVATFVGADASVHMAEEVSNAALTIPRAICTGMIVNGLIGFAMMVTVLYCLGDVATVEGTATGFPFIQIFYDSVGTVGGAIGMGVIVLILTWACSCGITTTASRMTWSFARDKGLPFSRFIGRVSTRTQVPVVAICVVTALSALLVLINIGSAVAFNDVISLTITGFYGSYFFPCSFLLYHRIKGHILPYGSQIPQSGSGAAGNVTNHETTQDFHEKDGVSQIPTRNEESAGYLDSSSEARLVWGPWKIPGILGTINNAYACVYMIFVIFWSVWPPAVPVSGTTMNYSIVVTGGVMILSAIWYFVRGRKEYKGPVVDDEVVVIARRAGSV